jgi:hypothetical protein
MSRRESRRCMNHSGPQLITPKTCRCLAAEQSQEVRGGQPQLPGHLFGADLACRVGPDGPDRSLYGGAMMTGADRFTCRKMWAKSTSPSRHAATSWSSALIEAERLDYATHVHRVVDGRHRRRSTNTNSVRPHRGRLHQRRRVHRACFWVGHARLARVAAAACGWGGL